MKAPQPTIRFVNSLSAKLFASYVLVIIATILAVLFAHRYGVRKKIHEMIHQESKKLSQEVSESVAHAMKEQRTGEVPHLLRVAQHSTRYYVHFVSFEQEYDSLTQPFKLNDKEQTSLLGGGLVEGDATGRVDAPQRRRKRVPPPEHPPQRPHWTGQLNPEVAPPPPPPPPHRGPPGPQGFPPGVKLVPGRFVAAPVVMEGRTVGAIVVYHTRPDFSARAQREAASILNSLVMALLVALVVASVLAGNLTRPLRRMKQTAEWFAQGEFSARTGLSRGDELGVLARAFDDMASELETNAATRTRLLCDVSHELGTPITTIRATLEALQDNTVSEEEKDSYLQSLLHQVEHLTHIVNDVTELSRFETGAIEICQGVFRADLPLHRAAEAADVLASRKNITVEVPGEAPDLQLQGDVRRITQVVKNLLLNAVQHNPSGTRVKAFWRIHETSVTIVVSDNGPMISEEDRLQLCERFYKADKSRTRGDSGSGLGLAISAMILKAHQAELEIEQKDGEKFFSFTLERAS